MSTVSFLGKGWGLPLLPDAVSRQLEMVAGPEKVRQSMFIILETEIGERVMRPAFGCGLRRYLMKPNTVATRALIQREVEVALRTWEPRIELQAVVVSPGDDPAMILIHIAFVHVRDGSSGNLVYPFYLQ